MKKLFNLSFAILITVFITSCLMGGDSPRSSQVNANKDTDPTGTGTIKASSALNTIYSALLSAIESKNCSSTQSIDTSSTAASALFAELKKEIQNELATACDVSKYDANCKLDKNTITELTSTMKDELNFEDYPAATVCKAGGSNSTCSPECPLGQMCVSGVCQTYELGIWGSGLNLGFLNIDNNITITITVETDISSVQDDSCNSNALVNSIDTYVEVKADSVAVKQGTVSGNFIATTIFEADDLKSKTIDDNKASLVFKQTMNLGTKIDITKVFDVVISNIRNVGPNNFTNAKFSFKSVEIKLNNSKVCATTILNLVLNTPRDFLAASTFTANVNCK